MATVECVLLYGCESWSLTSSLLGRSLDGFYTRMLRAVHNIRWHSYIANEDLSWIWNPPYNLGPGCLAETWSFRSLLQAQELACLGVCALGALPQTQNHPGHTVIVSIYQHSQARRGCSKHHWASHRHGWSPGLEFQENDSINSIISTAYVVP